MKSKTMLVTIVSLAICTTTYAQSTNAQNNRDTLAIREEIVDELQRQAEYDKQHEKAQKILDIIIPKVASSFYVCDGHLLVENINNQNDFPIEIYQDGSLEFDIELADYSSSFSQADYLNGYQWQGSVSIGIGAGTYRPAGTDTWQNRYSNGYDIGDYRAKLIYKNNQLVKPIQTQYMSNQEYYNLPYFKLLQIIQYKPSTCADLDKKIKSIKRKDTAKKVGAVALGILDMITK